MFILTADIVLFGFDEITAEINILLIRRKNPPFEGLFAFPGGKVELNETIEQAAARELLEETGIAVSDLYQFHVYSAVDRDPRGRYVDTVFLASVDSIQQYKPKAGSDAVSVQWVKMNKAVKESLAFDHSLILNEVKNSQVFKMFICSGKINS